MHNTRASISISSARRFRTMSTACSDATQWRGYPTLVVAGALCKEGNVLIAQRALGKPGAGRWELPGGKLQTGETPEKALRRELEEEVGAVIGHADNVSFATDAPNRLVLLLFACTDWAGDLEGKEGQTTKWVALAELEHHEMLTLDEQLVLPLREFMMGM